MMWFWRAVFVVLLLLLSASGGWLYHQQQLELRQLQQDHKALNQQLGDLNDRLVAIARQQTQPVLPSLQHSTGLPEQTALIRQNVQQGLVLAQAALQQGRADDADVLLQNIEQVLQQPAAQLLAPAVVTGLRAAIQTDRKQLLQQAQRRQTASQAMDRALMQIQQQLGQMARQNPVLHQPTTNSPLTPASEQTDASDWFTRLAQVVSIQRVSPEQQVTLAQRALLCREVALTLGLARHAVRQQQPDQLRSLLQEAIQQLSRLPDAEAVQARQAIERLLSAPVAPPQLLKSLSLLPASDPS